MGSSRNRTDGRWKIARATMSRCAIPPDSAYTEALAHRESWNCSSSSVGDLPGGLGPDAEQPAVEVEVLPDGQLAVQGVLLGDDPAELLGQRGVGGDVDAAQEGAPGRRDDPGREHASGGGLACAVRSEEAEDLAGPHVEVELVHRREVGPGVHLGTGLRCE